MNKWEEEQVNMQDTLSLIIVADRSHQKYANYLSQLISLKDDEDEKVVGIIDGSIKSTVWSEKDYLSTKVKLPSSTLVVFIGDSKAIENETAKILKRCYKYGVVCGGVGTEAFVRVREWVDSGLFTKEKYKEFLDYANTRKQEVEAYGVSNEIDAIKAFDKIGKTIKDVIYVSDLQYNCLTTVFYLDGLKEFIEAQHGRL